MGEKTKTPRTDAFAQSMIEAKVPESRCWPHWRKFAMKQETDLQHLARVAEEALETIAKNWPDTSAAKHARAALSEIKRIKTKI